MKNVAKEVRNDPWGYLRTVPDLVGSRPADQARDVVMFPVLYSNIVRGELLRWFNKNELRFGAIA